MIGRQIAHFHIIRSLGSGGMGTVYEAQDTRLPRTVALKVIRPSLADDADAICRFTREARLASTLNHRNICTVFEADEADGQPYIAMELLRGTTLGSRLNLGPMSTVEVVALASQVADGLAAAHAAGIMHRDVTPGNIFLTEARLVKLLDFGLARRFSLVVGDDESSQSTLGEAVGTLRYMAPEQIEPNPTLDYRCDLFSLGVVMYQMATGVRPFDGRSAPDVMAAIRSQPHVPIRQLVPARPAALEHVIDRLLAKRPEDRTTSAATLRDQLHDIAQTIDSSSVPDLQAGCSLAVLRFAHTPMRDTPLRGFAEGLADEMNHRLMQAGRWRIAPRRSVRAVGRATIRELGARLRVDLVLDGTVQRDGERLQVAATLIDARREQALLAPIRVEHLGQPDHGAQLEIARQLCARLAPALDDAGERSGTQDMQAFLAYQRGRQLWATSCYTGGWPTAIQQFEEALARDPSFAAAHVAMATAYNFLGYYCLMKPNLAFTVAAEAAGRALALDDTLASGHVELASASLGRDWDWSSAEYHYREAIRRDPAFVLARIQYSWMLALVGRDTASREQIEMALSLSSHPFVRIGVAHTYYLLRQHAEAIATCDACLQKVPDYVFGVHIRGLSRLCLGQREAVADLERVATLTGRRTPFYLGLLGLCYGEFGMHEQGRALVVELDERAHQTYVHPHCYVLLYSSLGGSEKAAFQERAYEHGASPLNYLAPYLRELYAVDREQPNRLLQMRLIR